MYCTSFVPLFQNSASITAPPSSKMHPRFHIYSFALLSILCLSTLSWGSAKSLRGFSSDLIDRDPPCKSDTFKFDLTATKFTYLMTIKVDTDKNGQAVTTKAIPDTGSELLWLNGVGCKGAVCQHHEAPFVKMPTHSYLPGHCPPKCKKLVSGGKCCAYDQSYVDGTTSSGVLTNGDIWLHGKNGGEKAAGIWFGVSTNTYCGKTQGPSALSLPSYEVCEETEGQGHKKPVDDNDKCMDKNSAGIVGLGHSKKSKYWSLSLIHQLVESCGINFKFSYCLPAPDSKSPGKLIIGNQTDIPQIGESKKSTPLVETDDCESHYCVQLASVSCNEDEKNKIKVSEENNIMIIDSGTSFTFLVEKLFDHFIDRVKSVTEEKNPKKIGPYANCFKEEDGEKLKKVSLEFAGTTVELKQVNFFDRRLHKDSDSETEIQYLCLTVMKSETTKENILGGRGQIDIRVGFNVTSQEKEERTVTFEADGCRQNVESLGLDLEA